MEKEIKIKFVDFWSGFTEQRNCIWRFLKSNKKYNVVLSDDPDYIVYGPFGDEHLEYNNAIKIFYTGEYCCPDFNLCDYGIGFDYMNFDDRYFRWPLYFEYPEYKIMLKKHIFDEDTIKKIKTKFCSFVYSDSKAVGLRRIAFERISEYKNVDSGGRYLNNIGKPVEDKLEFESNHKFSMAIENASINGYSTEKLVQSFAAQCVPIYYGDPKINEVFNEKALINLSNFKDLHEAVEYIKKVDNDDALYFEMLRQPALKNENYYEEQKAKFDLFLENIFSQDKGRAYRRTRVCWNKHYVDDMILKSKLVGKHNKSLKKKLKSLLVKVKVCFKKIK